jgi:hypothetical protein
LISREMYVNRATTIRRAKFTCRHLHRLVAEDVERRLYGFSAMVDKTVARLCSDTGGSTYQGVAQLCRLGSYLGGNPLGIG